MFDIFYVNRIAQTKHALTHQHVFNVFKYKVFSTVVVNIQLFQHLLLQNRRTHCGAHGGIHEKCDSIFRLFFCSLQGLKYSENTQFKGRLITHTLADTFCNNNSSLRACVALSEILIFIGFVHAISKIFISIFVMIKYGVTLKINVRI